MTEKNVDFLTGNDAQLAGEQEKTPQEEFNERIAQWHSVLHNGAGVDGTAYTLETNVCDDGFTDGTFTAESEYVDAVIHVLNDVALGLIAGVSIS